MQIPHISTQVDFKEISNFRHHEQQLLHSWLSASADRMPGDLFERILPRSKTLSDYLQLYRNLSPNTAFPRLFSFAGYSTRVSPFLNQTRRVVVSPPNAHGNLFRSSSSQATLSTTTYQHISTCRETPRGTPERVH